VRHEYQGLWNSKGHCDIESCTRPDGKRVFIATELPSNPGTSITNMAQQLATAIRKQHGLLAEQFIWIEHYPTSQSRAAAKLIGREETYDLVRFALDDEGNYIQPQSKRLTTPQLEGLLSGTLETDAIWAGTKKGEI
jgi:hypothetical protein